MERKRELDQQRDVRIVVAVSIPEKRKFQKMAKDRHTDLSELVRQLLHKESEQAA